ncbi:MAG: protease inhibitor I42 family protein [Thermoleophilia bacterium]
MIQILVALLIALAALGGGIAPAQDDDSGAPRPPADVTATDSDSITWVRIKPGETVDVTLKSNPTTGYHWEINSYDKQIIEPVGEPDYTADPGSEGLTGAGGTETFTFRALAEGETDLKMDYLGPDGKPSSTTYDLTIKVRGEKTSM